MSALQSCWRPRPILQFLQVRQYRPLLNNVRSLRTRPGRPSSDPPSASDGSTNNEAQPSNQSEAQPQSPPQSMSDMLATTPDASNNLLAPVHIPEDPRAILKSDHPSTSLLEQSGIVVQRQIEMMNVFLGFEQANRYVIMDPHGNHIGYMAEHDGGIAKTMGRQWFRTHRAFTTHVFGRGGEEVLRFHRPFSWINTRIRVYDPVELRSGLTASSQTDLSRDVRDPTEQHVSSLKLDEMRIIGEAQSEWAPLRRKYNLFLAHELAAQQALGSENVPQDLSPTQQRQVAQNDSFAQFAYIDEPFLSWDFSLKGADGKLIGSVNRNWGGLGREFFTDTGTYVLRMDAVGLDQEAAHSHIVSQSHQGERAYAETLGGQEGYGMTLDQRAVMLATAVTVDFDYFSRHSRGGGIIPMPFMMGGGSAAEGAAGAGAAGAAGAEGAAGAGAIGETVGGGALGTAGRAATGLGAGEGAMAGAGTMAGYEAMQRGMGRDSPDDASPQAPDTGSSGAATSQPYDSQPDPNSPQYGTGSDPNMYDPYGGQGQPPPDGGDVWGSGDADPYAEGGSNAAGSGGDGEGGGGIIQGLWDTFFGD